VSYAYDSEFARATPAAPRRAAAPADTPPGAEERLEGYRDQMDEARHALAEARNTEVTAKQARDKAARKALLSEKCPKVGVFGGIRTTVAYQKAWVEDQVADLDVEYQVAKVARQAAAEHLRTLGQQGGFQQSITASVRESYRGTNGRQW
jgi:hypothetical protein